MGSKSVWDKIVAGIKRECCYVALDPTAEKETPKFYELPDGSGVQIGSPAFMGPEVLFRQNGPVPKGIHFLANKAIENFHES